MKDDWLWILILVIVGLIVYERHKQPVPGRVMNMIGQRPDTMQIAKIDGLTPRATRTLAQRIVVASAGTPKRFPRGKPVGDVRLSTAGNTGTVYVASNYVEAHDAQHRFSIATGANISLPFVVEELSTLWLDAATDNDSISILCQVEN